MSAKPWKYTWKQKALDFAIVWAIIAALILWENHARADRLNQVIKRGESLQAELRDTRERMRATLGRADPSTRGSAYTWQQRRGWFANPVDLNRHGGYVRGPVHDAWHRSSNRRARGFNNKVPGQE